MVSLHYILCIYYDVIPMYMFSEVCTWCICGYITWRNYRIQENKRDHDDGGAVKTRIAT